jgi:hypothetical protein
MIPPITIIIADDMLKGKAVAKAIKVNLDSCAVITQPSYMHYISFYPNETIYAHSETSNKMIDAFNDRLKELDQKAKLKYIKP